MLNLVSQSPFILHMISFYSVNQRNLWLQETQTSFVPQRPFSFGFSQSNSLSFSLQLYYAYGFFCMYSIIQRNTKVMLSILKLKRILTMSNTGSRLARGECILLLILHICNQYNNLKSIVSNHSMIRLQSLITVIETEVPQLLTKCLILISYFKFDY